MSHAEIIHLLEDNAEDLKAQGLPEAAADLRKAVRMLERAPLLVGEIHPGGQGNLPARIVLHQPKPGEWATHMECLQENGKWSRTWGHYFNNLPAAAVDFGARCIQLTGGPQLIPWLEHAVETCPPGLTPTGQRLLEVLR